MIRNSLSLLATGALALLTACNANTPQDEAAAAPVEVTDAQTGKPKLGLFTTLPIYWGEAGDISEMIDGDSEPDWVRTELETRYELVPLDTLEAEALDGLDQVLLAQPRALAPSENVAFDAYLAQGGKAVILADPMLTRHSEYGIGDRRRPQDVVLLSPIFSRMGLELLFDEEQGEGERLVDGRLPVNLAGRFVTRDSGSAERVCTVASEGLRATCRYGRGEVHLLADAAVLDWEGEEPVPEARKAALWSQLDPISD